MSGRFVVLVPLKSLDRAKSRLGEDAGRRARLMRAFALDAVAAAVGCPQVDQVYVVTDEPLEVPGAELLPDEGEGDLNRALRHAAIRVRLQHPTTGVAAMCGDLPALRTDDLTTALSAGLAPRWFVADADGTGTTLLAAAPGVELEPHFGADSARRHEESGAVPVSAPVPSLRADVDTDADLRRALELGVGGCTRGVLSGGEDSQYVL